MAGLLYKEFILNKKSLFTSFLGVLFVSIFIFFPARDVVDSPVYTFAMALTGLIIFAISGAAEQSIFSPDERKKWVDFISSTPLSVKGQVLSKYYFSLLISLATFIYCFLAFSINSVIQGSDCGASSIAYMLLTLQLCIRSVEFPFLVRFGSKHGNNIRIALGNVVLFIVFVYFLFGDMSIFGSFEDFMDCFARFVNAQNFTDIMLVISAIVPVAAIGMYILSYKISCKLYLKGAKSYDK